MFKTFNQLELYKSFCLFADVILQQRAGDGEDHLPSHNEACDQLPEKSLAPSAKLIITKLKAEN